MASHCRFDTAHVSHIQGSENQRLNNRLYYRAQQIRLTILFQKRNILIFIPKANDGQNQMFSDISLF